MNASRYHDATPHPDRLIEASHPRPEGDDNRGYVVIVWMAIAICTSAIALFCWVLWLATSDRVQTELLVTPEAAIALMEGR